MPWHRPWQRRRACRSRTSAASFSFASPHEADLSRASSPQTRAASWGRFVWQRSLSAGWCAQQPYAPCAAAWPAPDAFPGRLVLLRVPARVGWPDSSDSSIRSQETLGYCIQWLNTALLAHFPPCRPLAAASGRQTKQAPARGRLLADPAIAVTATTARRLPGQVQAISLAGATGFDNLLLVLPALDQHRRPPRRSQQLWSVSCRGQMRSRTSPLTRRSRRPSRNTPAGTTPPHSKQQKTPGQ